MNDVIVDGNTLRPGTPQEAALAFTRVEAEMAALDGGRLAPINVDIPRAVVTALGARPALLSLRPRIVEELPRFPLASLDKLETYALAAWYAHLLSLPAAPTENAHKPLVEEATALRADLLIAAEALAHRKLVDPGHVAQIRSGKGHIDMASDLVALSTLFTNNWAAIEGKTVVTSDEIERAAILGPELLIALGVREQAPARSPSQIADQRKRAFTLLVRAYDDCRRAVSYLRWTEGDAAKLVPSLFAKRPKAGKSAVEAPEPDMAPAPAPEPSQPAPTCFS